MSLKSSTNVATNKYELEISVDAQSFRDAVTAAYRKNIRKMNVPGFRKGKAPQAIVERLFGEGVFFDDAVSALYGDAYEAAVKEAGLDVVGREDMEITEIGKDKGFTFKAVVITKPEVTLGEYKNLSATKEAVQVTDEEVDAEINRMRERNARIITAEDREAQNGDTAVFDFEGTIDGVPFDGGKSENFSLELGSGQFIPGFEDQMLGHKAGDAFDVKVTFPEEYHAKELAGKDAVFAIKLHELKIKELPALDDEFAKDVSEFDTLEDLKKDIRTKMTESKEKAAQQEVENQLIDQIIAGMQAEIPEVMFESAIDRMVQDFDYRLQMQGMNLEMYMNYTGMQMEEFRKTFREQAEKQVKIRLALEKIVEVEALKPTEEAIEKEFEKLAENYKMTVEEIKKHIPAEDVAKDLAINLVIDLVKDTAVVGEAAEKKAPAKKPAAKRTKKAAEEKKEEEPQE